MDLRIKSTGFDASSEIQEYIQGRAASIERLLGTAPHLRLEVEVGKDAGGQRHGANLWFAEMRVVLPGMKSVYARNNAASVTAAVDDVKEEIERQIRRERKFHIRLLRTGGSMMKRLMRFPEER
jgi:ribosome-associated translation inhibitor RaiA